jgi:hypothetical protein
MPPHHHHHHEPQWLYNAEGPVTRDGAAQLFERFAHDLRSGDALDLEGFSTELPAEVHAIVRLERTPRGSTALKVALEWRDDQAPAEPRGIDALLR